MMADDPIDRTKTRPRFWERFPMEDLPRHEWEALCDGCGKCCLLKLEDADTAEIEYTNVSCRLLDNDSCRCGNYALRKQIVKDCVVIRPENIESVMHWIPLTCAYRLVYHGQQLPDWHPLITGRAESVHEAGVSLAGKMVPEYEIDEDDLEDYSVGEML